MCPRLLLALFLFAGANLAASGDVLSGILVQGNVATSDDAVRQLAGIAVGDPVGPETVDRVAARLRASKRFDRVEVRTRFASIADPTQVLLVIIVDEGRVRIQTTNDPAHPTRVVRTRWPNLLFLPVLNTTDGYGLTYGGRLAVPNVLGDHSRLAVPLTWGGDKRAGLEFDRTFANGLVNRLSAAATVSSTTNPYYSEDVRRQRLAVRAEHEFAPSIRAGAVASWQHITFPGADDAFAQVGADLVVDTRDDPLLARNAVYARLAWDRLTLPGGVNRSEVAVQAHIGLIGRPILVLGVTREDADAPLPPYLKQQLGGLANLRGFPAGVAVGDTLLAGSAELVVPIARPFPYGTLGVSAFVDEGVAYDKGARLVDQTPRLGYGSSVWLAAAFVRMSIAVAHGVGSGTRVNAGGSVSF